MTPGDVLALRLRLPLDRFALDVELATSTLVTGIFGPSGAGKTSLIECVAGLRRDATGSIRLGDEVWLDSDAGVRTPPERRRVGLVPQDGLLFAHLDVRGNLLTGARARGDDARVGETFDTVVSILELKPFLARRIDTLSGGERQRVALGRAVCSAPRLLLLDEPLAALDLPLQRRILPFLRRVREIFPIPMLVVSHDPIVVQALCDDLVVLVDGAVRARGAPRTVLTDPAVFPLAEAEGFQNILPCRVVAEGSGACIVRLGGHARGPELHVVPGPHRPGDATVVSIPASDVILAVEEPRGLSARNVLPGVVDSIADLDGMRLVRATLGEGIPEIAAEVTPEASAELALAPGRKVHLIVKTAACRLFGA